MEGWQSGNAVASKATGLLPTGVRILYPPPCPCSLMERSASWRTPERNKSARSSVDRTSDSGSESRGFESLRAHHEKRVFRRLCCLQENPEGAFFLIGKHSGYHKWVLPKGLIEKGEHGWQTAVRETEEEMGVKAKLMSKKPIHKVQYFYYADKTKVFKTVSFYLGEHVAGDPKNHDWEMEEAGWYPFKEALKKMAFDGEKEALKKAQEMIK